MKDFRYLENVVTLQLDRKKCIGCGMCISVCPHRVLRLENGKAEIVDIDGCMECGACAMNCPVEAVSVTPGVGCATYIIQTWLKRKTGMECGPSCC